MFHKAPTHKIISAMLLAAGFLLNTAPVSACTGIMLKTIDNSIVHGRTLEFAVPLDTSIAVIPRGYRFIGQTPMGAGMQYTSKYAALGMIAFKDPNILDGINEKGLAVGVFYFPGFAEYTPVSANNKQIALSPADFPNWILTQFASIPELRKAIENNQVVVTPTLIPGWGPQVQPFHYVAYDKSGMSIAIEPVNGKLVVHDNPFGVMTNSPTFDWHMTNFRNYITLSPNNIPELKVAGQVFTQLGQGNGMFGLPGDYTPPSRFIRAAMFSTNSAPSKTVEDGIKQVFHILNNFDIPLGVARETTSDVVQSDYTMLTAARDPQNLIYYYKSYDDQTIRMVQLNKFDLNARAIKLYNAKSKQTFVNISDKLK